MLRFVHIRKPPSSSANVEVTSGPNRDPSFVQRRIVEPRKVAAVSRLLGMCPSRLEPLTEDLTVDGVEGEPSPHVLGRDRRA